MKLNGLYNSFILPNDPPVSFVHLSPLNLFSYPCIIQDRPPALVAIMYAYVLFPVALF